MSQNPLWTLEELIALPDARLIGSPAPITGASIDTRTLQKGDVFFALQDVRDGHEFVPTAFDKGAAISVVQRGREEQLKAFGALLVVPNVLKTMCDMGIKARERSPACRLAVTGSVGKTSVKDALLHVLSRQAPTHASVASYNNHFGVPLTLARMPKSTTYGVFEMGMSAPFEILPLTKMVAPHVALITTVEPVHIEFFKSIEGIADAKGEIFAGIEHGGIAVLNRDNPHFERMKAHAQASKAGRILTFGAHGSADVRALSIDVGASGSDVNASLLGSPIRFHMPLAGRHQALNALAILAGVYALGADWRQAAHDLSTLTATGGRGTRETVSLQGGSFTLIDESYNANPASMRAALGVLASIPLKGKGKRIAVLGDMLELGEHSAEMHAALAQAVIEHKIDQVFVSGSQMKHLFDALPSSQKGGYALTSAELEPMVVSAVSTDDIVMIKGSNGARMGRIVAALRLMRH
jgi:UDP-N-acetylmuramoyl-tripeptide--D-alanyl-D-alanine ligase